DCERHSAWRPQWGSDRIQDRKQRGCVGKSDVNQGDDGDFEHVKGCAQNLSRSRDFRRISRRRCHANRPEDLNHTQNRRDKKPYSTKPSTRFHAAKPEKQSDQPKTRIPPKRGALIANLSGKTGAAAAAACG